MLIIIEKRQDNTIVEYAFKELSSIKAHPGSVYTIKDTQTDQLPEGLILKRDGDDLEIEVTKDSIVKIEKFYGEDANTLFSTDGS